MKSHEQIIGQFILVKLNADGLISKAEMKNAADKYGNHKVAIHI